MILFRPLRSSVLSLGHSLRPALAPFAMALAALLFTACPGGGGGGAAPGASEPVPVIQNLRVEPESAFQGSKAKLSFIFTGSGQVDGGVGAVTSGVPMEVAADADKVFTLTVTGGGGRTEQRSVTLKVVRALKSASPVPISAPEAVQAGRAGYVASVPELEGFTYRWSGENVEVTSDPARASVQFRPGVTGAARLDCVLTHADGRTVIPAAAALDVASTPPPPAVTTPRQVTAGQGGYVASIPVPDGGSVVWSVPDGTLTSDPKSPTVTFTAATSGTVEVHCQITDAAGVKAPPIKVAVPVVAAPHAAVIAAPAQAQAGQPATATVPAQAGCVHQWNITRGRFDGPATGESVNKAGTPGAPGSFTVRARAEALPVSITAPARVTAGHPGYKASVTPRDGHAYAWTVQNATATSALTGPELLFTPGPGGTVALQCVVTDAAGTAAAPATASCEIIPEPAVPVIAAPAHVTAGAAGLTASVPAHPGSAYAWTLTGGILTAGAGTPRITFTAGPSGTVHLACTITNAAGISAAPGTATCAVVAPASAPTLTGLPAHLTAGTPGVTATVAAQPNCTYAWTVTGATVTAGGTAADTTVTFTAGAPGTLTVRCAVINAAGTSGHAGTAVSTVVPPPATPALTGLPGRITSGTGATAAVAAQPGSNYAWTVAGGAVTAGGPGTLTVSCAVTNAAGQAGTAGTAACTIVPMPTAPAVTGVPAHLTTGTPGVTATVAAQVNCTYAWAVTGAAVTAGGSPNDLTVTFTAGAPGALTVRCAVVNAAGTPGTAGTAVGTVVPAPATPAITGLPAHLTAGTGATAAVAAQPGSTYAWTVAGGAVTAGGGPNDTTVTVTAGGPGALTVTCAVTNAAGQAGTAGTAASTIVAATAAPVVAGLPAQATTGTAGLTATVLAQSNCTYAWNITGGTVAAGGGPNDTTVTLTAGPAGTLTVTCAAVNQAGTPGPAGSATCTVLALPTIATITGLPSHLAVGANATATIAPQNGCTYTWNVTGGAVAAGGGPNDTTVTVTAGPAGTLTLTCAAANALGVAGPTHTATSTIVVVPGAPALNPIAAPHGGQSVTATVNAPDANLTYHWTITNGQLTSAAQGTSATFTAGDYGTLHVDCVAVNAALAPSPQTRATLPITPVKISVTTEFLANGMPYLQPGTQPSDTSLSLLWMRPGNVDQNWRVDVAGPDGVWHTQSTPLAHRTVDMSTTPAAGSEPVHRVYVQPLRNLPSGGKFLYRVSVSNAVVFQDEGKALKGPGQRQVVAVAGDLVSNNIPATRAIASRIMQYDPDLMLVPGDIVNLEGHARQYRNSFFSTYNAETTSPGSGATLLRNLPLAGCLGNNDTDRAKEPRGFPPPKRVARENIEPNGMAYYYYFDFPLNGPDLTEGLQSPVMVMAGQPHAYQPFRAAAGNRFLKMNNFSFDSGDVHWVFLDSMYYMDWNDANLQAWLTADLQAASFGPNARTWKIVVFHYPVYTVQGFHGTYSDDEGSRMRPIYPILQHFGVALVLSGHLHNYQRCRPFGFNPGAPVKTVNVSVFTPIPPPAPPPTVPFHTFDNAAIIEDATFTGAAAANNQTNGIISIVTGAGGAHFHGAPGHMRGPGILPTPVRFVTNPVHSFSLLEFNGNRLLFRQIDSNGNEVDRFVLVK
jgi:hypothetical protein